MLHSEFRLDGRLSGHYSKVDYARIATDPGDADSQQFGGRHGGNFRNADHPTVTAPADFPTLFILAVWAAMWMGATADRDIFLQQVYYLL